MAPFYTALATDADSDPLTFSITAGIDMNAFTITPQGALSFRDPPPPYSDNKNIYVVQVSVSDGKVSTPLNMLISLNPTPFHVRRVGSGFNQPIYLQGVPDGSGRLFVAERGGRVRILTPSNGTIAAAPFFDVSGQISTDGERGLLGFTVSPDFQTSGLFYVYLTNLAGNIEVRRYGTLANNRERADPVSGTVILSIPHPGYNTNYGGWIGFRPDETDLYIATGDGGGVSDPNNNSQNMSSLLGKFLRMNPATPGPARIVASGLRNPRGVGFDRSLLTFYIGDVGQNMFEEINNITPLPEDLNANFGWPLFEGTQPLRGSDPAGLQMPIIQYDHGPGPLQGGSVTGGYVYRGPVRSLQQLYIFGDFASGSIWSAFPPIRGTLPTSSLTVRTQQFTPDVGAINNISSFGEDALRNLYIVDYDGEIFVVEYPAT